MFRKRLTGFCRPRSATGIVSTKRDTGGAPALNTEHGRVQSLREHAPPHQERVRLDAKEWLRTQSFRRERSSSRGNAKWQCCLAPEPVAPFAFLKRPQMRHSGRRSQGQVCPQFLEWVNFIRLLLFVKSRVTPCTCTAKP